MARVLALVVSVAAFLLAGVLAFQLTGGRERAPAEPAAQNPKDSAAAGARPRADEPRHAPNATRAAPPAVPAGAPDAPAAPSDAPVIDVRVRTQRPLHAGAKPVPGIAFELRAPGAREPLATGRTGEGGEATVRIRVADPTHVHGYVVEPGHQRRSAQVRVLRGAASVTLHVSQGATGYGRVVDAGGAPVEARVECRAIDSGQSNELAEHVFVQNLPGGRFALHVARATALVLVADARERGTATLELPPIPLDELPRDLTLVAEGAGVLRGLVRGPAGEPSTGLELLVLHAELDGPARAGSGRPEVLRRLGPGGGHLVRQLWTDGEGRFEVRGLRAASYVVRARVGAWREGYSKVLTAEPIAADGRELELVQARPRLVVRPLAADGTPYAGELVAEHGNDPPQGSWSERAVLLVEDAGALGDPPRAKGSPLRPETPIRRFVPGAPRGTPRPPPERWIFKLAEDRQYLVTATGAGFDGRPRRVEVPEGTQRVDLPIVCGEPPERATLIVRIETEPAEPTGRQVCRLSIEDPATGARPFSQEVRRAPATFELAVPAGSQRIVAEGLPLIDDHHGTVFVRRILGRSAELVDLIPGERRELLLVLDRGARLELEVNGSPRAEDIATQPSDLSSAPESAGALFELDLESGRPEPVLRTVELGATSAAGTHLVEEWRLGTTDTSQVLPAGEYTLVGRLGGGRSVRVPVQLVAGETTRARIDFGH